MLTNSPKTRRALYFLIAIAGASVVAACANRVVHRPLSASEFQRTDFSELAEERFWGDVAPQDGSDVESEDTKKLGKFVSDAATASQGGLRPQSLLAISGGSANGAFGVGVLAGWTESGKRPEFAVVTGISTGAMIAPFAFLGSDYDETLIQIYSSVDRDDVFLFRRLPSLFFRSAVADTTPLTHLVETYVTKDVVEKIAEEHRRDRKLFIVTTHFDAMRPMVWDIGAIANRRGPEAVPLIRKIILASAAIPVLFPPIPIEIDVDGKQFTELHVDGSISTQVFAYPAQVRVGRLGGSARLKLKRDIYVIQNSNDAVAYEPAPVRVLPIAWRALYGLLTSQINMDVERIYFLAKRDGLAFHMISIPDTFQADRSSEFDPKYMAELLEIGAEIGRKGDFWFDKPPAER